MQKKWIFLAGLVVCLLAGAWAYYNYQKPRTGTGSARADYIVSADALYREFSTNEAAANAKYNGKIIEVKGVVTEVVPSEKTMLVVLSGGEGMGGISCSFSNTEGNAWPKVDEQVTIKGVCSGFLMDVNLVDAVLVN